MHHWCRTPPRRCPRPSSTTTSTSTTTPSSKTSFPALNSASTRFRFSTSLVLTCTFLPTSTFPPTITRLSPPSCLSSTRPASRLQSLQTSWTRGWRLKWTTKTRPPPLRLRALQALRPHLPPASSPPMIAPSTARPLKRKTDDSDYEADADTASESSDYVPHRPAKRPATRKRVVQPPLPDSLQPIRVGSTKSPLCPLPGCGASLEAKDSAWRGHFKRFHHDELCLARGCRGLVAGTCKARCPLPESCASDHGNKHTHGASAGAMSIESVGRHLLNVHIKVAYRCPLCGLQNEWRESACVRHIRRCAEKHGKQMSC
ncbi:hypothetical protein OH76DRAFT_166968 [Lentinus brumalis]|uniref:Uncharacterized protein n=1 Tax=Lentinus brumalis TaxID=2498619 RepID=A0A371DJ47_9APHY|nr:hypothetical protein OH76DRAFT_166968 [Polyporus brumalis]